MEMFSVYLVANSVVDRDSLLLNYLMTTLHLPFELRSLLMAHPSKFTAL